MNLGLAAATFAIVIPAELPDKTFISCVVLGSRHRPLPVWCGAASGLVLQAGIAAAAGRLLALAPHRVVEGVVAALFLAGAAVLLLRPERSAEEAGEQLADAGEEGECEAGDGARAGAAAPREVAPAWRVAATTFGVIVVAELGDLTQVVVANLAARYGDPWSVFLGAAVAFVLVSAVAVAVGRTLTRFVPLALVRRGSGVVLAGLGVWSAANAIAG